MKRMKKFAGWITAMTLSGACVKERPSLRLTGKPVAQASVTNTCIDSYQQLVNLLGNSRVRAQAVVLENGVVIQAKDPVNSILYEAVDKQESYSLFRSLLTVSINAEPGYPHLFNSEVWSLGCVYLNGSTDTYTNLVKDRRVIMINTVFFWNSPPYVGERIAYLVLQ
jgi:hypothetical protein